MQQTAPYPAALADLIGRITYKPGWSFDLRSIDRGQGSAGLTVTITITCPDSYEPDSRIRVAHYAPVPPAAFDVRAWQWWLFRRILEVETHEAAEFYQVDGRRPWPPNHSPGRDPYQILELGTAADAETDFRGVRDTGSQQA
jgi:hypothetical protein